MSIHDKLLQFQVNALSMGIIDSAVSPNAISFDVPLSEPFNRKFEGFASLGIVPNADDLDKTPILTDLENYTLKFAESDTITIPNGAELLLPAIQMATAYEVKHSSRLFHKEATLHVREHTVYEDKPAPDLHRDPPKPILRCMQNTYVFTSTKPTEFPFADRQPEPYEMICFTSGAPHRTPEIRLEDPNTPLRRLFVGVTFHYMPPAMRDKMIKPQFGWEDVRTQQSRDYNPLDVFGV